MFTDERRLALFPVGTIARDSHHRDICIWIYVFGPPAKFQTGNGGEFADGTFTSMCESLDIAIKTTAAQLSWCNGLVEIHNLRLSC